MPISICAAQIGEKSALSDWNSTQYMKFENERTRPSVDLINRIDILPKSVLDIGCGPGNSTAKLFDRFEKADILGIDASEDMLLKAKKDHPKLKFQKCVLPDGLDGMETYDLIFFNACLHWVPGHETLFPKLMQKLNSGGVLAVQMPLVQNAEFYRILGMMTKSEKWQKLSCVKNFHNLDPNTTYDILSPYCEKIEMWETVYYHTVSSCENIIDWYKGSGLRPYLDLLSENEKKEFLSELLFTLKEKIPVQNDHRVLLKMPRLFFTATKK